MSNPKKRASGRVRAWGNALVVLGVGVALGACAGGDDDALAVTAERCATVRERMIELRLDDSRTAKELRAPHRAALRDSLGAGFVETCVREFAPAKVACLTQAKTSDALRACEAGRS